MSPRNIRKTKEIKVLTIMVITIAFFIFIPKIPKKHELDFKSLSLFPPDKKDNKHPIVFLHIGKCGGTSFDFAMWRASKYKRNLKRYVGFFHFDWSYIDKRFGFDVKVLTILRHPVDRAISHFNFAKTCAWTKGMKMRNQTMTEYLDDAESMLETRKIWMDGEAGVMWLAGLHVDFTWVTTSGTDVEKREAIFDDTNFVAMLTVERLLNTTWFGVLEDMDRSMKMLSSTLGTNVTLGIRNENKHEDENEEVRKKLADLMQFDIWMYEYALQVFEARWKYYLGYKNVEVPMPSYLPERKCKSTVKKFECKNAEAMGSFNIIHHNPFITTH